MYNLSSRGEPLLQNLFDEDAVSVSMVHLLDKHRSVRALPNDCPEPAIPSPPHSHQQAWPGLQHWRLHLTLRLRSHGHNGQLHELGGLLQQVGTGWVWVGRRTLSYNFTHKQVLLAITAPP